MPEGKKKRKGGGRAKKSEGSVADVQEQQPYSVQGVMTLGEQQFQQQRNGSPAMPQLALGAKSEYGYGTGYGSDGGSQYGHGSAAGYGGSAAGYGASGYSQSPPRAQSPAASNASYSGHGYWQVTPRRDFNHAISRGKVQAQGHLRSEKEVAMWQRKLNRISKGGRPASVPVGRGGQYPMTAQGAATMASHPSVAPPRPVSDSFYGDGRGYQQHNALANKTSYYQGMPQRSHSAHYGAPQGHGMQPTSAGYGSVDHTMMSRQGHSGVPMLPSGSDSQAEEEAEDDGDDDDDDGDDDDEDDEDEDGDPESAGMTPRDSAASTPRGDARPPRAPSTKTKLVPGGGSMGKWVMLLAVAVACCMVGAVAYDPSILDVVFGDDQTKSSDSAYGSAQPTPTPTPAYAYTGGWWFTKVFGIGTEHSLQT